jgi:hypothetical protein
MNKAEKYFAEKASQLLNTEDAFYDWLNNLPPDAVVGYSRSGHNCPIAVYAKNQGFPVENITFNHLDISFGEDHSFAVMGVNKDGYEDDGVDETPYWFSDFVQIIDRVYKAGDPVLVKSAKAIIKALKDPDIGEDPDHITLEDILRFE